MMVEKKGTLLILQLFTLIEMSAVHEQILDWWKDVSRMKPTNCKLDPKHLNPYPANVQDLISSLVPNVYFSSHSCSESSKVYQNYHFNGRNFEHKTKKKIFKQFENESFRLFE